MELLKPMAEMSKQTGLFRKLWIYFKKGKTEIWFLIGIWNTIQLWGLRGQDQRFIVILFGVFSIGSLFVGYILIKKVETTQTYVSPATQDAIKSSVNINEGFIQLCLGNNDIAIRYFKEARRLREKWLDVNI